MGEIDAIETGIDTLVALNIDSSSSTQLGTISDLLDAYLDADVDALNEVQLEAELKNAIDCIEKLIDWVETKVSGQYTDAATVGALLGFTISATTRPTSTALGVMLLMADGMINGPIKQATNITDTYGLLAPIATQLVMKMVNNILAFAEPDKYDYIDIRLSPEDERDIRLAHSLWQSESWKMGID